MAKIAPGRLPFPALAGHPPECMSCGYDLRGLPDAQRCPECGVGVAGDGRDGALFIAGLPRTEFATPGRRWILALTIGGWFVLAQPAAWFVALMMGKWWVPVLVLAGVVAGTAWLIVTGPKKARSTERIMFTGAGIGRSEWGSGVRLGFIAWRGDERVRVRSLGSVWQKVEITRPKQGGGAVRVFVCGFRCQRERLEWVGDVVTAMVRGTALPGETPPPGVPDA